jgi:hypothetical protein
MPNRQKKSVSTPLGEVDFSNLTKVTPYIQRVIEDAELRDNVRTAFDSTKSAYERLANGKAPARALIEDKKLQRDLQNAIEALRDASNALSEGPKKKKARRKMGFGRMLMLGALGFGLALAGSEALRTKVLDTIFGKEEEFEYTPPPSTASTPPSQPVASA